MSYTCSCVRVVSLFTDDGLADCYSPDTPRSDALAQLSQAGETRLGCLDFLAEGVGVAPSESLSMLAPGSPSLSEAGESLLALPLDAPLFVGVALAFRCMRPCLALGFASLSCSSDELSSSSVGVLLADAAFGVVARLSLTDRACKASSLNTWVAPVTIASTALSNKNFCKRVQ